MGIGVCGRGLLKVEGVEGVEGSTGIASAGRRQQEVVVASDGSGIRGCMGLDLAGGTG